MMSNRGDPERRCGPVRLFCDPVLRIYPRNTGKPLVRRRLLGNPGMSYRSVRQR